MENDLQYMDTKLSMVDDSTVIKRWVTTQLNSLGGDLQTQLKAIKVGLE